MPGLTSVPRRVSQLSGRTAAGRWLALLPVLPWLWPFARVGTARADAPFGARAEVAAGAGHDTNMILEVSPAGAGEAVPVAGWFGRVAPTVAGSFGPGRWRIEAEYALDARASGGSGPLYFHDATVTLTPPPLGALQFPVALAAGVFQAPDHASERFVFVRASVRPGADLPRHLRVEAGYAVEGRRYGAHAVGAGPSDFLHGGDLRLAWSSARIEAGLGGALLVAAPGPASAARGTLEIARAGPDVTWKWRRLTGSLEAWAGAMHMTGASARARAGGGIALALRLSRHLDLTAALDWIVVDDRGDLTYRGFERRFVGLGVAVRVERTLARAVADAAAPLRPLVGPGAVVFRLRAEGAASVTVIGSWDDWAPAGRAMAPGRVPGVWVLSLPLPTGTHRYRFLVDGNTVRPPDAPRYAPDGFGGQDGVVEVPGGKDAP